MFTASPSQRGGEPEGVPGGQRRRPGASTVPMGILTRLRPMQQLLFSRSRHSSSSSTACRRKMAQAPQEHPGSILPRPHHSPGFTSQALPGGVGCGSHRARLCVRLRADEGQMLLGGKSELVTSTERQHLWSGGPGRPPEATLLRASPGGPGSTRHSTERTEHEQKPQGTATGASVHGCG